MCKKPDVKCAVVEVAHRSISDILYKYFTCNYSFRYIVFPPKFVRAYNDAEHSTTDMATSPVTDSNVLAIWKRSEAERRIVRVDNVKINVGQHERISKEKMMFAKGAEQNFSTEIFRIAKVVRTGGFKRDSDRGTILRGRTHTCSHLKRDHLRDR